MSRIGVRLPVFVLVLLTSTFLRSAATQNSPRPLRASEVMAIEAGGALQENIAHDIATRGLNFHPDDAFLGLMKKAGADGGVIAALKSARVDEHDSVKPDMELLGKLSDAAVLIRQRKYDEASTKLSEALDSSFARMETGFVMAEVLQLRVQFESSAAVYDEIMQKDPDFPEVRDKAAYVLYRLQDDEAAFNQAKTVIAEDPQDAEAHMNAGLVLSRLRNFDAAISEFKEALRIKPDYAGARSGLGLVYERMGNDKAAIEEYKKAIALDPDYPLAHYNLGNTYLEVGNVRGAIAEFRDAKRLCPDSPEYWHNLGVALSRQEPRTAIKHFREMEARFPNFEICHVCLGNDLVWVNDLKAGEEEYRKAMKLDPADPRPHVGLGDIEEKQKNYDAALVEYRIAEQMDGSDSDAFKSAGKLLLEDKKDFAGAAAEFKNAEAAEQSNWEIHELYGKALAGNGQGELAIAEFKEALALDPRQGHVMTEIGLELEKKGDWVGALEQYRKGAAADEIRKSKALPGEIVIEYEIDPKKQYTEAKARFGDHLVTLRAAGKKDEAAELEKRVAILDSSAGTLQKVEEAIAGGDAEMRERHGEESEKYFKQAVELAQTLPPGNEYTMVALGKLGNAYAMQQKYEDAEAAFHQEMTLIEKTFGPGSPRLTEPLRFLGSIAAGLKKYVEAESYFSRALQINLNSLGENSGQTSQSLMALAGLYEVQSQWDKAEPYLLRALKAEEVVDGPDGNVTLFPLWGLCDMYDRWGKPEKSQPCWHRVNGMMEKNEGANNPVLKDSLMAEANAWRKLGRNDEAQKLEERIANILKAAATQ
ncbi:MAG TPA: tetratricopeptide repeat protein [Candidatus Eisenbacteria bacterium]|nr:tetratricopeptide repeat protein [Candidatus Eisenbacteria bacterium]